MSLYVTAVPLSNAVKVVTLFPLFPSTGFKLKAISPPSEAELK